MRGNVRQGTVSLSLNCLSCACFLHFCLWRACCRVSHLDCFLCSHITWEWEVTEVSTCSGAAAFCWLSGAFHWKSATKQYNSLAGIEFLLFIPMWHSRGIPKRLEWAWPMADYRLVMTLSDICVLSQWVSFTQSHGQFVCASFWPKQLRKTVHAL